MPTTCISRLGWPKNSAASSASASRASLTTIHGTPTAAAGGCSATTAAAPAAIACGANVGAVGLQAAQRHEHRARRDAARVVRHAGARHVERAAPAGMPAARSGGSACAERLQQLADGHGCAALRELRTPAARARASTVTPRRSACRPPGAARRRCPRRSAAPSARAAPARAARRARSGPRRSGNTRCRSGDGPAERHDRRRRGRSGRRLLAASRSRRATSTGGGALIVGGTP